MQQLRDERALMCVDWEMAKIALTGGLNSEGKIVFDISAHPCHFKESSVNGTRDFVRDDCVVNLDEAVEYLRPMHLIIYYNSVQFMQDGYGDASTKM